MIITRERVEEVDKKYWSPQERAVGIMSIIEAVRQEMQKLNESSGKPKDEDVPTYWDILCFAVEYTSYQVVGYNDDLLLEAAKTISRWLYSLHYAQAETLYARPDRPEGS